MNMKNFIAGNLSRCKLFTRTWRGGVHRRGNLSTRGEEKYGDRVVSSTPNRKQNQGEKFIADEKIEHKDGERTAPYKMRNDTPDGISTSDSIHVRKQRDFLKKIDEDDCTHEDHSTVRIFKPRDAEAESNFLPCNDKYNQLVKKYNEQKGMAKGGSKTKKSLRFGQTALPLEDEEKSLWEILKEKEDYLRNKKKMKNYQKDLDQKMNREYHKVKKEEQYMNSSGGTENRGKHNRSGRKVPPTNPISPSHDDIDRFLSGDQDYTNEIKSYDEIYRESSLNRREEKRMDTHEKMEKGENNLGAQEDDAVQEDTNELNINKMIHEDLTENTLPCDLNERYAELRKKKVVSEFLVDDLDSKAETYCAASGKNSLFVNEVEDISARRCIGEITKGDIIYQGGKDQRDNQVEKKSYSNECTVEVTPADALEKLTGQSLSTIIDGNIDNLIIQREIKKEKTAMGIITVLYNNLQTCDNINLSSALIKMSKMMDSYQKGSVTKNYMYLNVLKKIDEKLGTFEMSNLVQIFYAFVKIEHFPYFFNDIINNMTVKLKDAEPKHVCSILYTLSNILLETNESRMFKMKVIDLVKSDMLTTSTNLHLNDVISLLTSLSKLKFKDVNTYYELSKRIEENVDQLNMKNVSNILWAFSHINYTCKLVKKLKKIVEKDINKADHLDLVNIVYSLTKLNEYDEHLYMDIFYNAINVYLHHMSVKNLCIVLWSYTYVNAHKPDLYINILTKLNENVKQISTKDIVSILTCLSRIQFSYKYKHLFSFLKNKVVKNLYAFSPLQITNVMYHSSFLEIHDHKFYYLLVQQVFQIRHLLYLENLVLILYALKNVCYLNVHHMDIFRLIAHILQNVKRKYKLLCGEDCVNIMLIINDLAKYSQQGYLVCASPQAGNAATEIASPMLGPSSLITPQTVTPSSKGYIDIFDDNVNLTDLPPSLMSNNEEEVYLPHISDLLYEQIKLRLHKFWQLSIKDVNNLLIIMRDKRMHDDVILNMIMRQIIPILSKSTNMEFLIFLSNITASRYMKFVALTHMSRRPKLIGLFKKKINSITSGILNSYQQEEDADSFVSPQNVVDGSDPHNERTLLTMRCEALSGDNMPTMGDDAMVQAGKNINGNGQQTVDSTNEIASKMANTPTGYISHNPKTVVDLNSCVALCYACFNIHYEDDNVLKLYDLVEHMIIEERRPISSFMLINFIYILALTNNKMALVRKLSQEYMHHRYAGDLEKNSEEWASLQNPLTIGREGQDQYDHSRMMNKSVRTPQHHNIKTSFNLFYEENDKLRSYLQKGDEEASFLLLKMAYVNILINTYHYLYQILCEISTYSDEIYTHEFFMLAKQVCYHVYNFLDFFSRDKEAKYLWNKVAPNVYINENNIYLDLDYEPSPVNLQITSVQSDTTMSAHRVEHTAQISEQAQNHKIGKSFDNNLNIAKFFYHVLNYNMDDVSFRNANSASSREERKKIKMFHFDHVICDILNFLNVQYKGSYTHENIYKVCCSFPYERHLIDLMSYEDVLYPSHRPLLSADLRQKQLALKGWTVHAINFRDLYNSVKDKNVICYIFNIVKKIKKDLNELPDDEKKLEEKNFWDNLQYANM
ncbi:conserved Plasmodium protein, unknown function [Plasmodium knowlesi strain H]|uniref:RAP domain-containing protein n=3 Tax=Plasmodium knowlesi TaxID=5850 RepID=A0A5K1UGD6_PLAKH|nr:conserved Plasmodium protein, unknown function [Plasmodium knowlesi strain H]OTN64694.1 Uncharacterized protein PKNOH_S130195000 [Plasmodium knowlesi]CAA9989113.1 conserved Plasmodium protein, unknown function [Plasmodium knowlesi strain H]SBO27329.1 conserved Plasmodium protein, unknown function [Plasmodium knowlesi strain H]SBO28952.1 conserved Plasmodium protein, unknown function [Plasmodium knowlesi strain H]VVS78587.1 conserved Plasmodium protein, unknown function [Plasmodium knowlesi |eukprot:XP_002261460.1 hypothetical protein, conserved in Plasmodium species [Plasmodium knowlesi strain H]